ncbi:hypothetical protein [Poriferisphaera sp. WC338]|uniref:hypothetical protein n=1 Tax=Poriferisphaera sp. WC338 TaxID=3425129 RepID=UPI003D81595A
MNWLILVLVSYGLLAVEMGTKPLISLPEGLGGMAPSLLLVLGVYVVMMGRGNVVLWVMLGLGVVVDLMSSTIPGGPIVGPNALGFLVGGIAVLQMRGFVFRESVLAMSVMVFACGIFASLVAIFMIKLRGLGWLTNEPVPGWQSADQMYRYFMMLVYTTVLSLPLGFVLMKSTPMWGFGPRAARNPRGSRM